MTALGDRLRGQIGKARLSGWLRVDQSMIDQFAATTFDEQFIHVDPERSAQGPFGSTIAHGFLTLSLLSRLRAEALAQSPLMGVQMTINYGFDRLRFIQPVREGACIRACFTDRTVDDQAGERYRVSTDISVEIDQEARPALVASWITMIVGSAARAD